MEEWCLPQRTGTRRYLSMLQDLLWRYERVQERIDSASNCVRRRYDNARRLCTDINDDKCNRAVARLVRHYALQLSLLHIMSLSLAYTWRTVLYCVRAVSDAPIPLPSDDDGRYGPKVYNRLHETCRDQTADAMSRTIAQVEGWLDALDSQPTVRTLDEKWRVQVVRWTNRYVLDAMEQYRNDVADAWSSILDYCDRSRIDGNCHEETRAQSALAALTGSKNGGETVTLISRHSEPLPGKQVTIPLPLLTSSSPPPLEATRLVSALRAVGG